MEFCFYLFVVVLTSSLETPRPDHLVFKSKTSSSQKGTKATGAVPKGQRKGQTKKPEVTGHGSTIDSVQRWLYWW